MTPSQNGRFEPAKSLLAPASRFAGIFSSPIVKTNATPEGVRRRWWHFLLVTSALGMAGYLASATAVFAFARGRQGLGEIAWADFALPTRWSRYQAALGRQQIEAGRIHLRAGHAREALLYLRAGLVRVPDHRDGRLLLARALQSDRRPEAAVDVLIAGLRHHRGDPEFLAAIFALLHEREEDQRIADLARELLRDALPPAAARVVALAGATANHLRGNHDRADEFLRATPGLATSCEGRLLAAKIARDRGDAALALSVLRALAAEFPDHVEVQATLTAQLREAGLPDEARRASVSFQIAHPQLASPRLELLHAYRAAGETAPLAREIDAWVRDFSDEANALLALGDFAAVTGDAPLARRLLAHAEARHWPAEPYRLLTIEALVVARDYRAALEAIHAAPRETSISPRGIQPACDSLQAICHAGLGDLATARSFLERFLGQPGLRPANLLAVADRLASLGATDLAHSALVRAVQLDPHNSRALHQLVALELESETSDELPAHVARLLTLRRPSRDLLRVAAYCLESDRYLYAPEGATVLAAVRAALAPTPAIVRR